MAANRIFIQVDFQSQSAESAIQSLNQNIESIGTTANQSTQQATQSVKGFSVAVNQAQSAVDSLSQSVVGMGVARMASEIAQLGDSMIRLNLAFAAVPGGLETWDQLRVVAEKTGFGFQNLLESANQLKNAGVPVKQITMQVQALADAVAKAGGGNEALQRVLMTIANIQTRGYLTGRETIPLREAGIDLLPMLSQMFGQTVQQIRDRQRLVSADSAVSLIMQEAQRQAAGAAAARAEQLPSAQFQRLKDDAAELSRELMTSLAPALKLIMDTLRDLMGFVKDMLDAFNALPESVRTAAGALVIFAGAIKVVTSAMTLWNLLPAAFAWLPKLGTWIAGLLPSLGLLTGEVSTITTLFTETAVGGAGVAASFGALLAAATPLLVVITSLMAVWEGAEFWKYLQNTSDETTKAMGEALKKHEQMAQQAQALFDKLPKAAQEASSKARGGRSFWSQNIEELGPEIEQMKKTVGAIFQVDQDKIDEVNKKIADLFDEQHRKLLVANKSTIAALEVQWQQYARDLADQQKTPLSTAQQANLRKSLDEAVQADVAKRHEETRKEMEKTTTEILAAQRKVAIAQDQLQPDDTFAGRIASNRAVAQAWEEDIRAATYNQDQQRIEETNKRIEDLKTIGGHQKDIDKEQADLDQWLGQQRLLADTKVAEHRLTEEGKVNKLLYDQRKQLEEEALNDQLTAMGRTRDERLAYLRAQSPDSLPQRLDQLRQEHDVRMKDIQDERDARLAAAQTAYDEYAAEHPGFTEGIAEEYRKLEHTRTELNKQANSEIYLDTVDTWKAANDAIIEEQKKVYEGIKGALDKVWDALITKGKSVWSALGEALKTAMLNAIKEIVTSRLAAMLAGVFGYGQYEFKRGVFGITEPPSPSGLGMPPAPGGSGIASSLLKFAFGGGGDTGAATVSSQGSANREVADDITDVTQGAVQEARDSWGPAGAAAVGTMGGAVASSTGGWGYSPAPWSTGGAGGVPRAAGGGAGGFGGQFGKTATNLRDLFNIGKPVTVTDSATGIAKSIPWAQATSLQRLQSIITSKGVAQIGLTLGSGIMLSGLQHASRFSGDVQAAAGATLAGASAALLMPGAVATLGAAGAAMAGGLIGLGGGVMAAGLVRGGVTGGIMSTAGGALLGASIGTFVLPGLGTLAGAAIGAGIGAIAGAVRYFLPDMDQRIRSMVKQVYGIDIPDRKIRDQIAQIITQTYGGNVNVGVYSQEVQNIVRLYAATTGQQAGLPRPMYGVTEAQQGGQLTTQPVYSNGQLVQNPYTGTTTYQYAQRGLYMQLNPNQAMQLFSGQVVSVMQNNPSTIAQSNAAALAAGNARYATAGALLAPNTVMA